MQRIGVDIGGTFTDIVYLDDATRQTVVNKTRTTPADIGRGVLEAVRKIAVDLSGVSLFIHGTTAGINAVVQRKGAKVGLLTTAGFTDVLEMARGDKKELYDYMWKKPAPLVPRHLRLGLTERTDASGAVLQSVDEKEVVRAVETFRQAGVEAVAVCLLHSYINPANEVLAGRLLAQHWPGVTLALSHLIACEIREYERMSTTVINAYVEKLVVDYLERLDSGLRQSGFAGQLLVLGPSGVLGVPSLREKAIYSLGSGPIGGAAGSARLADQCGIRDVVTMDVGGTTFDVSLIKNGRNVEKHQSEIMGYPLLIAGMDIQSIGAGGGSIARVDAGGLLTVGPDSAGADPGPLAYGRGGREPTVTDAALVNGLIDPDYFLGGEIRLDLPAARQGIESIASALGTGVNRAAAGILSLASNNMINATQEILVGQGFDPRDFTLVSFGGAGGLFAAEIARGMSIARLVIPVNPGVFSARGILTMDVVHTYSRAHSRAVETLDTAELEALYQSLETGARGALLAEGLSADRIEFRRSLDIGYAGQRYYLETPVAGDLTGDPQSIHRDIGRDFVALYRARYGNIINAPLQTLNLRLKAVGRIPDPPVECIPSGRSLPSAACKKPRRVFLEDRSVEVPVFERRALLADNRIEGPAIIEEPFHVCLILPGQTLRVDRFGNLDIQNDTVNQGRSAS